MADSTDVTPGINATATQFNNLRKDVVLNQRVGGTETDGATITIDWSDKTKGAVRTIVLGAAGRTLAFTNMVVNQVMTIRIAQDNTGNRTITTWPNVKWPSGTAPTLSTIANKVDIFQFLCTDDDPATFDGFFAGFGLS